MLTARTCARGNRQRHDAEDEGHGGHDDWAQTHAAGLDRRVHQALALFVKLFGELDDQNGVFRRQTHRHQQPDLEEHVVGQTAQAGCHQCTDNPQWHHEDDRDRNRPAFIQRRQTEEHDQQRQGIQGRGLRTGQAFLVGQTGPRDADALRQLLGQRLDFVHRVAAAVTRGWRTEHFLCRHAVVA